jgi:ABC-type branched-subunit amino acid transport system substrate-binding protein
LRRFSLTIRRAPIRKWLDFNHRFEDRFNEKPEQFASLAYDAMNALLDSICKAGPEPRADSRRAGRH